MARLPLSENNDMVKTILYLPSSPTKRPKRTKKRCADKAPLSNRLQKTPNRSTVAMLVVPHNNARKEKLLTTRAVTTSFQGTINLTAEKSPRAKVNSQSSVVPVRRKRNKYRR